jgi:hypothetical protein
MCSKEGVSVDIIELLAIVSLKAENGSLELSEDGCVESDKIGNNIRFVTKRECPSKM